MFTNIRLRAALCLALSLGNAARARADDEHLYRWVDRDGGLHITATPPPADARETASAPDAPGPVQVVPVAPPAAPPAPAAAPSPPPPPPAAAEGTDPCQPHRDTVARWLAAKQEVRDAQDAVERIEANPILGSHTGCTDEAILARRCTETWYSRDEELTAAHQRQAAAERKLARVEESARVARVPMVCLVDPAE